MSKTNIKFCKVVMNCSDCGNDVEVYGPFDTEKEAYGFEDYQEHSIYGMTCSDTKVVEIQN